MPRTSQGQGRTLWTPPLPTPSPCDPAKQEGLEPPPRTQVWICFVSACPSCHLQRKEFVKANAWSARLHPRPSGDLGRPQGAPGQEQEQCLSPDSCRRLLRGFDQIKHHSTLTEVSTNLGAKPCPFSVAILFHPPAQPSSHGFSGGELPMDTSQGQGAPNRTAGFALPLVTGPGSWGRHLMLSAEPPAVPSLLQ